MPSSVRHEDKAVATVRFDNQQGERRTTSSFEQPLTSREVGEMLGAHYKTIEKKARKGEIPGHFKLNHWYFFASELDKWLRVCESSDSQFVSVN
jgi:excisionase family DNA binding protein